MADEDGGHTRSLDIQEKQVLLFLEDYQESSAYIHTTIEKDFRNLKSVSEGLTELQEKENVNE